MDMLLSKIEAMMARCEKADRIDWPTYKYMALAIDRFYKTGHIHMAQTLNEFLDEYGYSRTLYLKEA